ncbi:MAG: hypothetical protein ACM31D_00775 [Bacteroidota bacterium]
MTSLLDEREQRRARFVGRVRRQLKIAFAEAKKRDVSQADVARTLDVDPAVITRQLNGSANLTLATIGDLAWALGLYPQFELLTEAQLLEKAGRPTANKMANATSVSGSEGPAQVTPFRLHVIEAA